MVSDVNNVWLEYQQTKLMLQEQQRQEEAAQKALEQEQLRQEIEKNRPLVEERYRKFLEKEQEKKRKQVSGKCLCFDLFVIVLSVW